MMNERLKIYTEPFLKGNKISKKDFENLFGEFDTEMMDIVLEFMEKEDIEIVLSHDKSNQIFYSSQRDIKSTNEELCVMYQRGNDLALDALIQKNERLIYSRVMKYKNRYKHDLSEEDLFQEGSIGLMKAVERFDNSMGFKLTTYSIHWIDQAIRRAIANKGFTIRVPVHMFEKVNKLNNIYREINVESLSSNEAKEIILMKMDINESEFDEVLMIYYNIISLGSLNIPIGEDRNTELGEMIEANEEIDVFDIVVSELLKIDISLVLETINSREKEVLVLRFGLNNDDFCTLEEIGNTFNLTRERIRQIEAKALRRLRHPSRSKKIRGYLYDE